MSDRIDFFISLAPQAVCVAVRLNILTRDREQKRTSTAFVRSTLFDSAFVSSLSRTRRFALISPPFSGECVRTSESVLACTRELGDGGRDVYSRGGGKEADGISRSQGLQTH